MSRLSLYALFSCLVLTGSALAGPTVTVDHTPGYYYGDGGEFTMTPNAELGTVLGSTAAFQSFCLERTELVSMGVTYDAVLNTEALQGGLNDGAPGPGGGDPLDARTAYLYSQFTAGTLAGYDYGAGRPASAQALQDVIWYLEDESALTWSAGSLQDSFYTAAQDAVDSGSWTGLGNVRVLNLYAVGAVGDPAFGHQDLLASVAAIPAPGALVLVSLGTGLAGWLRRRRVL